MERILIVDDDERLCASVAQSLKSGGYNTRSVTDPRRVEESVAEGIFDCAIVDLRMLPELGGLEVAKKLKSIDPAIAIVFLTGTGTVSDAVEAFKLGATDFLIKPVGHHQLLAAIAEALEKTQFSRLARISSDHPKTSEFAHVVGQSPKLLEAIERAKLAANHDEPVLILGETGSGKDLFASEIHATSPRRKRPFLTTVVGARPEGTVLSELFGHVKSAFTGADKTSP
ncbi:MAG: response regulator, partial [Planctomycetota bacterium]